MKFRVNLCLYLSVCFARSLGLSVLFSEIYFGEYVNCNFRLKAESHTRLTEVSSGLMLLSFITVQKTYCAGMGCDLLKGTNLHNIITLRFSSLCVLVLVFSRRFFSGLIFLGQDSRYILNYYYCFKLLII